MTDKKIKSYLEDRLKMLESIRNEREWTASELGDIACCKQTLAFIDSVQEEPVSEELEKAAEGYAITDEVLPNGKVMINFQVEKAFRAGAKWQKEHLWKPDDGDNLPEIDREVIALTQPYPNDEHLKVVFAHRPNNKYAKVWNSDLGEEQVIELEWFGKGEWNIPFVKYWLDAKLPYEIKEK